MLDGRIRLRRHAHALQLALPPLRTLEEPQHLDHAVLFDGTGDGVVERIAGF